jgi:hypothetical protein
MSTQTNKLQDLNLHGIIDPLELTCKSSSLAWSTPDHLTHSSSNQLPSSRLTCSNLKILSWLSSSLHTWLCCAVGSLFCISLFSSSFLLLVVERSDSSLCLPYPIFLLSPL